MKQESLPILFTCILQKTIFFIFIQFILKIDTIPLFLL